MKRNNGGGQLRLDHIKRPVLAKGGELTFGTLDFGFPSVARCRFSHTLSNHVATTRQHKTDS